MFPFARNNWWKFVVVFAAYFITGEFGLMLAAAPGYATAVWLPSGIALLAVWHWGNFVVPAIWLSSFLLNVLPPTAQANHPLVAAAAAAGIATGSSLQVWLLNRLGRSVTNDRPPYLAVRDSLVFSGLVLVVCVVSATIGVFSLWSSGILPSAIAVQSWRHWWLGDCVGILIVAPLVLAWPSMKRVQWDSSASREAVQLLALTIVVSVLIFGSREFTSYTFPITYLPILVALLAAKRFYAWGGAFCIFVVACFCWGATAAGTGPFATDSFLAPLYLAQSYLGILSVMACSLGAAFYESEYNLSLVRETEAKIGEYRSRLTAIVEHSGDAIFSFGLDGNILTWNKGAELSFGFSEAEVIGRSVSLILPEGRDEELSQVLKQIRNGESLAMLESVRQRKDGSHFPVLTTVSPVRDASDAVVGCSVISKDISTLQTLKEDLRKTNQALKQKVAELEEFTYIASHDLQEPVRMVSTYCQLLEKDTEGKLSSDAQQYIQFAVNGSSRARELIDDLLSLSRVGRSKATPPGYVSLSEIAQIVTEDMYSVLKQSDVEIEWKVEGYSIRAERSELSRLFLNLLSNAAKYRRQNVPVRIEVGFGKHKGENAFYVRDNGLGIAEEYYERIFKTFQRLHSRDEFPGNGVGLAICKKIVEHLGGRIWVESKLDEGSVFYISFPDAIVREGALLGSVHYLHEFRNQTSAEGDRKV